MKKYIYLDNLLERFPKLNFLNKELTTTVETINDCFLAGRKILICGNGGSAADSDHVAAELMKDFKIKRILDENLAKRINEVGGKKGITISNKLQTALPAISLTSNSALISAISNDIGASSVFSQQVVGLGDKGDILIAFSTSGNSENIIEAAIVAKAKGLVVIGFTGNSGGELKPFCDLLINVPEANTFLAQELHLASYHAICLEIENQFFKNSTAE